MASNWDSLNASSNAPLPNSGERVMMPPARSSHRKAPKGITPAERGERTSARNRRQKWEASPEGQARTTGFPAEMTRQATPAQIHMMNRAGQPEPVGPRVYDRQLPGMSDPDAAPRPPKWEELSPEMQQHAIRGLARKGTDIETMTRDFGAQIDQAEYRAMTSGPATADAPSRRPYAEDFYSHGEPRQKIDSSSREHDIPPVVHAQLNAFTSPNTKFSMKGADGVTKYPNDDAAVHSAIWARSGRDPKDITNDTTHTIQLPKPKTSKNDSEYGSVQGYTNNIKKAAEAMSRHDAGLSPDPKAFEKAPKTGPYANSWSDTHPQFTVADVHSGGGGAFPHLGTEKTVQRDEAGDVVLDAKGSPKRDKSEREIALERTPYAHSAVDYANRQAMAQRGLGHVRESQAAQWGEEQLQRGEAGMKGGPKHADVYPPNASTAAPTSGHMAGGEVSVKGRKQKFAAGNWEQQSLL